MSSPPRFSRQSVVALDCNQASNEAEKAICATPAALAADAEMNKAYGALRALLDSAQRAALAKAQAASLSQRDGVHGKHGADLGVCLADETGKRSRFLNAAPEAGPGYPGKLVPFFLMEKGGKGKTDVDVQAFRFARPASGAERALNAAVDKSLGDIRQPQPGDHSDTYAFGLTITLATPRRIYSRRMPKFTPTSAARIPVPTGSTWTSIRTATASSSSTTSSTKPALRKSSRIVSIKRSLQKRNTKATTPISTRRR